VIPKVVQLGKNRPNGGQVCILIAVLGNQLPSDFCSRYARIEPLGTKLGVGLALAIDKRLDIVQQLRQVFFGPLAPPSTDGIKTLQSAREFVHRFAEGFAIPAKLPFGEPLAPWPQGVEGLGLTRCHFFVVS